MIQLIILIILKSIGRNNDSDEYSSQDQDSIMISESDDKSILSTRYTLSQDMSIRMTSPPVEIVIIMSMMSLRRLLIKTKIVIIIRMIMIFPPLNTQ